MHENAVFAYFLVDCARYRSAPPSRLPRLAHDLRAKYLVRAKGAAAAVGGKFPVSLARGRPLPGDRREEEHQQEEHQQEEQDPSESSAAPETDRDPPPTPPTPTQQQQQASWVVDISTSPANTLGIAGALVDSLVSTIEQNQAESFVPSLFDELDDVVFSLTAHKENAFKESPLYNKYVNIRIQFKQTVAYKDFQLFRTLGRGGFGLVNGCKKTQSGQLYAMKALCRKRIKLKRAAELCLNEKCILQMIQSPFIVCLQYAFTTPQDVFLVLDLMVGGDLGFYLHRTGGCFSAAECKYFLARTVLGLKALHDSRVVYRDLKPENILMDSKGRTKISDLGGCFCLL